jgi:hypothetical protein
MSRQPVLTPCEVSWKPSARLDTSYAKYWALYDFAFEKRSLLDIGSLFDAKF